jgi:hypothetical protein
VCCAGFGGGCEYHGQRVGPTGLVWGTGLFLVEEGRRSITPAGRCWSVSVVAAAANKTLIRFGIVCWNN